jgi:hypothetical protein
MKNPLSRRVNNGYFMWREEFLQRVFWLESTPVELPQEGAPEQLRAS